MISQDTDGKTSFPYYSESVAGGENRSLIEEIGFYLDNSRTAMLRYYDDAMNRAKFERDANAAKQGLVMARDVIGVAIESLDRLIWGDR